jgi:REP element-mobilizing transposase RayT
MARKSRKELDGKYFHILVQGIGKEMIFPEDEHKGYYLSIMEKAKIKNKIFIFAFCVMGNHAHILIKADKINKISLFMKEVNTEYARYYNNIMERVGYVFRGRFKSEVINDEKYLVNCMAYIHNNPVKAHIIKKAEDYKYSSYTNYLTKRGIVDFKEAGKHYGISPSNIKAIMKEKSHSEWLEHDDTEYEDEEEVFEELIKKYNITKNRLEEDEILKAVIDEMQERAGLSLRKIAILLEINRERVRAVITDKNS